MDAAIRVFTRHSTETSGAVSEWINLFEEQGYNVLIDSLHGDDFIWIKSNIIGPTRAFTIDETRRVSQIDMEDVFQYEVVLDLMITFNVDDKDNLGDLESFDRCVQNIFKHGVGWGLFETFVKKPSKQNLLGNFETIVDNNNNNNSGVNKQDDEPYGYREYISEELDFLIVEIKKPKTDKPYVTVIRDYSKNGFRDIFCNFYACPSWGVSSADNAFLQKVWEWKSMTGVFDCNEEVRRKIEKVEQRLEEEPKVWRSTMEKIISIISDPRYKGLGVKRSGSPRLEIVKR
jgi:hypothetical protein